MYLNILLPDSPLFFKINKILSGQSVAASIPFHSILFYSLLYTTSFCPFLLLLCLPCLHYLCVLLLVNFFLKIHYSIYFLLLNFICEFFFLNFIFFFSIFNYWDDSSFNLLLILATSAIISSLYHISLYFITFSSIQLCPLYFSLCYSS